MQTTPRKRLVNLALIGGMAFVASTAGRAMSTGAPSPATVTSTAPSAAATTSPDGTTSSATTSSPPAAAATTSTTSAGPPVTPARAATVLALVSQLDVKGRAPKTGYSRDQFGQSWLDFDRNGCDTRNDVLRRDLSSFVLKAGTHGCLVLRGMLHDPYTGHTISFVRGQSTSNAVQIDHVVALADAWQKGAQRWTLDRRAAFANDSLNLLAVDGPTNLRKGDGDTATWLPPNKAYRCRYVARQVAVKAKYHLWVTAAERDAMVRVLTTCPNERPPFTTAFVLGGGPEEATTPQPASTATAPVAGGGSGTPDPRFDTCKAAKAAGYGPYRLGVDPEYSWYRDADSDGNVCE